MAGANLDYLKEYSDNDLEFVVEMVELFLSKTPGFLEEMETKLKEGEFMDVGKIAHKMKPSMTFMSISNGKELCTEIEDITIEAPLSENLKPKVYELIEICETAFIDLESELKKLK